MADIMKELTGESDEHDIEIEEIQDILDPDFIGSEVDEDETETSEATKVKQETITENRHNTGKEATYKVWIWIEIALTILTGTHSKNNHLEQSGQHDLARNLRENGGRLSNHLS